jgi:pseudoazurin
MSARRLCPAVVLAISLAAGFAGAAEHEVRELNTGPGGAFVFEPMILRIAVGDTVKFLATDRNHQVTTIRGGLPGEAAAFNSRRNEDFAFTFTVPGVYAYECTSHRSLGMVGLIVVGADTSNLAAVKALDLGATLANQRLAALVAQAEQR